MTDRSNPGAKPSTPLSTTKEVLGVLREIALMVIVVVIIAFPPVSAKWARSFNDAFKSEGATSSEISLGFAKVTFENTTKQIPALTEASEANAKLGEIAEQMKNNARSPADAKQASVISETTAFVAKQLQESLNAARNVQLKQDQILQTDVPGIDTGEGNYGLVVSADKGDDPAAYEVQQLKKRGINNVVMYDRQGYLRTVARYSSEQDAKEALPKIRDYRDSAYVINLTKWCPNPNRTNRAISGAPVFTCN